MVVFGLNVDHSQAFAVLSHLNLCSYAVGYRPMVDHRIVVVSYVDLIPQVFNFLGNKDATRQLLLFIMLFRVSPEVQVYDLPWEEGFELTEHEDRILAVHGDV
jgi:hypothetical protein